MSVPSALLRLANPVVRNIISQILNRLNVVEEQAMNPIKAMVQAVTDNIWRGEGANAFVEEVTSLLIPNVESILAKLGKTSNDLNHAVETIEQADETVDRMIRSRLSDIFNFY
jgi:uncharacterized protein YukE